MHILDLLWNYFFIKLGEASLHNKQEKMRITNFLFVCSPDIKGNFEEKRKIKIKRECLAKGIY